MEGENVSFAEVKKAALDEEDFFKKLNYVQKMEISPTSLGALMSVATAIGDEKTEVIENCFKHAMDSRKGFVEILRGFPRYSRDASGQLMTDGYSRYPVLSKLDAASREMINGYEDGYSSCVQTIVYQGALIKKMAEALGKAYSGAIGADVKTKEELLDILGKARQIGARAEQLEKILKG